MGPGRATSRARAQDRHRGTDSRTRGGAVAARRRGAGSRTHVGAVAARRCGTDSRTRGEAAPSRSVTTIRVRVGPHRVSRRGRVLQARSKVTTGRTLLARSGGVIGSRRGRVAAATGFRESADLLQSVACVRSDVYAVRRASAQTRHRALSGVPTHRWRVSLLCRDASGCHRRGHESLSRPRRRRPPWRLGQARLLQRRELSVRGSGSASRSTAARCLQRTPTARGPGIRHPHCAPSGRVAVQTSHRLILR